MGIYIRNDGNETMVASVMPVVAANAPNGMAMFNEQLEPNGSVTLDIDNNSYLVVRPYTPVPSEANNDNG